MCNGVGSVTGAEIDSAASQLGIPCGVVLAQITLESSGNPQAVSPAGAEGVAQFEPSTWSGLGCAGSPYDVTDAMSCYVKFMKQLLSQFDGDILQALNQYNGAQTINGEPNTYGPTILANAGVSSSSKAGTGSSTSSATTTDTSEGLGGIFSFPSQIISFFSDADKAINVILWLFKPSSWLRIGSFFVGAALLLAAIVIFTKADQKISVPPVPIPVPV